MFVSRMRSAVLLTAPAVVLALSAGSALVATPPATSVATQLVATTTMGRYRTLVYRLAVNDPRWEVRSAATNAWLQEDEDVAKAFLTPPAGGYLLARDRASKNAARNDLIISRAIATSHPSTSPFVNMTAKRAQYGTLDEKNRYVTTGLAEAQALDAKHSPVAQAKVQDELDRRYVADLATNGSGAWVKAAARRAVQIGTDASIEEFFTYSWASAAGCDLQAFRLELAKLTVQFRSDLDLAIADAKKAQLAFENAAEAAKQKYAEEARLAWNTAADVAASTQATWLSNAELATSQARAWQAVHAFAVSASTNQDWPGIAAQAANTITSWHDELAWAQEQARMWTEMETSARASAGDLPVIIPTPTEG